LLEPRFFLFSAFGATARSNSGVAVAVSFRQNFILSTIGDVPLIANTIFDVVKLLRCGHIWEILVDGYGAKTTNLR
jgi:hypothetical protein